MLAVLCRWVLSLARFAFVARLAFAPCLRQRQRRYVLQPWVAIDRWLPRGQRY
jgi:hypothetical protein